MRGGAAAAVAKRAYAAAVPDAFSRHASQLVQLVSQPVAMAAHIKASMKGMRCEHTSCVLYEFGGADETSKTDDGNEEDDAKEEDEWWGWGSMNLDYCGIPVPGQTSLWWSESNKEVNKKLANLLVTRIQNQITLNPFGPIFLALVDCDSQTWKSDCSEFQSAWKNPFARIFFTVKLVNWRLLLSSQMLRNITPKLDGWENARICEDLTLIVSLLNPSVGHIFPIELLREIAGYSRLKWKERLVGALPHKTGLQTIDQDEVTTVCQQAAPIPRFLAERALHATGNLVDAILYLTP